METKKSDDQMWHVTWNFPFAIKDTIGATDEIWINSVDDSIQSMLIPDFGNCTVAM